jgi:hypothetical protein
MSYTKDNKTAFSNEGFRIRRMNPDGTYPAVDNHQGFTGTVDLTDLIATDVLSYRWDGKGDFTDIIIDLTSVGTSHIATVAEVVTALNGETDFSDVLLASDDTDTDRLKIENAVAVSGKLYLELKGTIAVALGFGKSGDALAIGTAFVECFDDSGAVGLPKVIKDSEEITQESSTGHEDTMHIDAVQKGLNPSIATMDELYELKVMLMGGVWSESSAKYTPPTSRLAVAPLCAMDVFVPKYGKGSMHRGDLVGYKMISIRNMTGREGDITHEVKSWANYEYTCMATEYSVGSVVYPAYEEFELTISGAAAIGVGL